ncbi:putative diguanylate cyclase YedQ [Caulifigura coniformis]|uniref:diguanylate cyclase n=1 Tax=Caulifigura coniformis TaxID=2527983 RepID=A0A517SE21_9PLAN|nr:GGDEF domain-containing protein [Caulifigura coniformis]QDT54376.1 putative diguanylate cyclase YedQ [Caulifigura coniformis]
MAGVVFAASLFGILTRPVGFLAAFWPANAVLLGLMVRYPQLATPSGWLAATAGYLAADLVTGGGLLMTIWLTAGNLAGAMTGVFLFSRLNAEHRHLRRPLSMLYLFAICAATGVAAAAVGGGAGPVLIGKPWWTSCAFWFATELVNGILLLPVILTVPRPGDIRSWKGQLFNQFRTDGAAALPVLTLLASMVCSLLLGGPGAIMFSVPALLWCALSYDIFTTACLTLLYCSWMLVAVSMGALVIHPNADYIDQTMSIRLGISLLALGPLTAAGINSVKEELLRSLNHAVSYDFLTKALARRAFMEKGGALVRQRSSRPRRLAVLMMDIDHFKRVNDHYGHAAGDQVLVSFVSMVASVLREDDLFGRLGGEEFAVVLPNIDPVDAAAIAERLRAKVETTPVALKEGEELRITVSVGLVYPPESSSLTLDRLLTEADAALYRSKQAGRNRVTTAQAHDSRFDRDLSS